MDLLRELDAITFEISTAVWNINTPQQWAAWTGSLTVSARDAG
jgi:hypothetical protein